MNKGDYYFLSALVSSLLVGVAAGSFLIGLCGGFGFYVTAFLYEYYLEHDNG